VLGMRMEVGFSAPCGPRVGKRASVRNPVGPPVYTLPQGLHAGEVVVLLHFDHGYWQVVRESDSAPFCIYMLNVDQVVT